MKNALLTLLFFVGLAATQLAAQSSCVPNPNCPPQCCIKGKSAATTDNAVKVGATTSTTTCTPEQMKQCTPEQLKQCAAAGQSKACCASKSAAVGSKLVNTTAAAQNMEAKPLAGAAAPKG